MNGKQYFSSTYSFKQGSNLVAMPVSNLLKGVYIVTVKNGDGKTIEIKFVK